jgi:Zn finger protein HypA/HybF involved in hydrogenase expression
MPYPNPDDELEYFCQKCDALMKQDLWKDWFCPECAAKEREEEAK